MKHRVETPHEFNNHHIWYPKSQYKHGINRQFRNTVGLVIPTPVSNHNQLHAELLHGPPKPPRNEMIDCMDYLEDIHPSMKVDRFWAVEAVKRFMIISEFDNEAEADRYQSTRWHLSRQIGILSHKLSGVEYPTTEELRHYGGQYS